MRKLIVLFLIFTTLSAMAMTKVDIDLKLVKKQLRQSGAVQFSIVKGWLYDDYENIYVGYDQQKKVKVGIIVQILEKSYEALLAYVVVTKDKKGFTIKEVILPGLNKIEKKKSKRKNIEMMLKKFKMFKCVTVEKKPQKIDAISSATFCHRHSYKYINEMAAETIKSMTKKLNKKMILLK
ncbi:MAG: hypothetical protein KAG98_02885 [Lentisphaeria bacterium]|nr:hypothetical protein [Lentisphaeria bacterium]